MHLTATFCIRALSTCAPVQPDAAKKADQMCRLPLKAFRFPARTFELLATRTVARITASWFRLAVALARPQLTLSGMTLVELPFEGSDYFKGSSRVS